MEVDVVEELCYLGGGDPLEEYCQVIQEHAIECTHEEIEDVAMGCMLHEFDMNLRVTIEISPTEHENGSETKHVETLIIGQIVCPIGLETRFDRPSKYEVGNL